MEDAEIRQVNATDKKEVHIRQATSTDKAAVLAINNNVYDGLDYLEAFFDEIFIGSSVATPYVAVYKDEIVGFLASFHVDDGNTVVTRAGRVKDELSGKGFYKKLKQYCLDASEAQVNAFMTIDGNKAIVSSSFKKENIHILTRRMTKYDFDAKGLQVRGRSDATKISVLIKSVLQHFMTSASCKDYLFPDNRLIVNWVPFKLLPLNIPIIWLMDEDSLRLYDIRKENRTIKGLLSISTTFYGTGGGIFVCQLDLYGTDCASLKGHIDGHIDFIRKRTDGATTMLIFCDECLVSHLENVFKEYDLSKSVWRSWDDPETVFESQCLFEKSLEK